MPNVNEERLEYKLTLAPSAASAFLESLNHRLNALPTLPSDEADPRVLADAANERDALIAVLMSWEQAVKSPAAARGIESLFGTSKLPALERAETQAREALTRAMENLAEAHAAFASSLSAVGDRDTAAASEMVSAGEVELDLAKSAYNEATGRVQQAKGREAEEGRVDAYARSQKAHDEAIVVLQKYEPLALELLKLFSVLSAHADLALADVAATEKARADPRIVDVVARLEAALDADKQGKTEGVRENVTEALRRLKPSIE